MEPSISLDGLLCTYQFWIIFFNAYDESQLIDFCIHKNLDIISHGVLRRTSHNDPKDLRQSTHDEETEPHLRFHSGAITKWTEFVYISITRPKEQKFEIHQ